jgi:hypothetical protein
MVFPYFVAGRDGKASIAILSIERLVVPVNIGVWRQRDDSRSAWRIDDDVDEMCASDRFAWDVRRAALGREYSDRSHCLALETLLSYGSGDA